MRRALLAVPVLGLALTALAGPAQAAGTNGWAAISQGAVELTAAPGLARTSDGALHVGYVSDVGAANTARQVTLAASGATGSTATIAATWASLDPDPKLIATRSGLTAILGGQRTSATAAGLFAASSPANGLRWTVAATPRDTPATSAGTAAVGLPDGTIITARTTSSGVVLGNGRTTRLTPVSDASNAGLVVSGGALWLGYASAGPAPGIYLRRVDPTSLIAGAATPAPGSSTGARLVLPAADEPVPLVARPDGSVWTAYCVGYPTCSHLGVWRLGSAAPRLLPSSADNPHAALSTTADGRLWVAWNAGHGALSAVRSNPSATTFGAIVTVPLPYDAVYELAADGRLGPLDAIVNAGQGLFHRRIAPGLSVKAKPQHWKRTKRTMVKVRVTDAGSPVKGAKVRARGKGAKDKCTTTRRGTCVLTFRPSKKKAKVHVSVTRSSYGPAVVTLKRK